MIGPPMSRLASWLQRRTPSTGPRRLARPPPKSATPQPSDARRLRMTTGIRISSPLPMTFVPVRRIAAVLAALAISAGITAPLARAAITLPPTQNGVSVYDLADIWDTPTERTAQQVI